MREQWTSVFDSDVLKPCSDRALVLHSLDIPYDILRDDGRAILAVPDEYAERARFELWQYDRENRKPQPAAPPASYVYHNGVPGVIAYVVVICLVAWLAGESAFGRDWLSDGRIDGALIRQGEWWRLFTALTLHAGLRHLLGNIGFGALFGLLAGRLLGSGLAWLGIVIASGAANALNVLLLESSHRSIGASTAVFAALGILSGFVWRGRMMSQDRWPYRLGPIVGGIALLAFTGTGDENTDVGAHLAGFLCGFATGMIFIRMQTVKLSRGAQLFCGAGALAIIVVAWLAAFSAHMPAS